MLERLAAIREVVDAPRLARIESHRRFNRSARGRLRWALYDVRRSKRTKQQQIARLEGALS